jgi:hypothetical protein
VTLTLREEAIMWQEADVGIELPLGYIFEHCRDWEGLCRELDLEADGLERACYQPSDRIMLDLEQAKRHGLCQQWWL